MPVCTVCGKRAYSEYCVAHKPRKPIKQIGKVGKKRASYRKDWIRRNGGKDGVWICYLQISPMCLRFLDITTLTLEHVIPKGSHPELSMDDANIRPACRPCNTLKGSQSLKSIRAKYT